MEIFRRGSMFLIRAVLLRTAKRRSLTCPRVEPQIRKTSRSSSTTQWGHTGKTSGVLSFCGATDRSCCSTKTRHPKQEVRPASRSRKIPELYLNTYRDYVTAPSTGFRGITISAVRLSKIDSVVKQLRNLANALLEGSKDKTARQAIFESRKKAHGFVFGLYVDIVDLCRELEASKIGETMKAVCDPMREAVAAVMIENKAFTKD